MLTCCSSRVPVAKQIAAYGMCLQAKSTTGLERGACEEQFALLKQCFQQAVSPGMVDFGRVVGNVHSSGL